MDRAHRQPEQLRDRRRRVTEAVAQHDHDPPLRREARHRLEECTILRGRVAPLPLDPVDRVDPDQPPLAAQEVERPVDDDPVQPGLERPPLVEARQRGERALEGVLRHVVGHVTPPGHRPRHPPGPRPVAAEELRGGVARPRSGADDQLAVGGRAHLGHQRSTQSGALYVRRQEKTSVR